MNQDEIVNEDCENNPKIMKAVKTILKEIGDDPEREGLLRTPKRFARACKEWFGGYGKKPEDVLNRTFPSEGYNELIVVPNIEFDSWCEHHISHIKGICHLAYIPRDRITGLDKFVKLVYIYAKRLQTQEVMTQQIGEAIKKVLDPLGVYVLVQATHGCVSSRETRNRTSSMMTTYRDGMFEKEEHLESRFLQLIKIGKNR